MALNANAQLKVSANKEDGVNISLGGKVSEQGSGPESTSVVNISPVFTTAPSTSITNPKWQKDRGQQMLVDPEVDRIRRDMNNEKLSPDHKRTLLVDWSTEKRAKLRTGLRSDAELA